MFIVPCGYPLSAYTPPDPGALPLPPVILADRLTKAGELVTILEGESPIDGALAWQFTVRQGSGAALGANGHRLHTITKATPQAPVQLADEARRVVGKFVERKQLRDVEVRAELLGTSTATGAIQMSATDVLAERAARLPTLGGE